MTSLWFPRINPQTRLNSHEYVLRTVQSLPNDSFFLQCIHYYLLCYELREGMYTVSRCTLWVFVGLSCTHRQNILHSAINNRGL